MRLMGECRGSIDAVKRAEDELTEDESDAPGLLNPTSADVQSAGRSHVTHTHTHAHTETPMNRASPLKHHMMLIVCLSAGVIERWELIQAQSLSEKHRRKQNLQQWQQLISDLQTMRAWLGQSEAELSQLRGLEVSTDIRTIQQRIKKLKVCLQKSNF